MIVDQAQLVSKILLERPASVRRHLPMASGQGWLLPDYLVGPENEVLRYLFDDRHIENLKQLSPVVFYGEAGVGKTALAITLAVRWARLSGLRPLCFATGQTFSADYSAAVEIDDVDSFRHKHRSCELLVIDDLQQIGRATAAQQELAGTLDALAQAERPVVVCSRRLPSSIRGLSPALASRLTSGFSIPLLRPARETITELIPALARQLDPQLPIEELAHACAHFDAKSLTVSDLHKIVALAAQYRRDSGFVDLPVLTQLAGGLFAGESPTLASISKVVARKMHVRLVEMRGATRQASIVRARGLAIFLTRKLTPTSLQQIGQFFGGRDHSTIIHACRKTEKLLDNDAELANLLLEVQAELLNRG
ncbi:MAG: AAA family ATPase [Planctomycetales bacterium]|nr:AAA family ATPase [Planctomycetales bacterium]